MRRSRDDHGNWTEMISSAIVLIRASAYRPDVSEQLNDSGRLERTESRSGEGRELKLDSRSATADRTRPLKTFRGPRLAEG